MRTRWRLSLVLFLTVVAAGRTPRLFAQAAQSPGYRVLIGFTQAGDLRAAQDRADIVAEAGGIVHHAFVLIPAVSAWVPQQALIALTGRPDVTYIEEDPVMYALEQSLPWGMDRIDADLVWPGGNTGAGVDVAILDTGIDGSHPDLAVIDGINYAGPPAQDGSTDPADWNDGHGHGTHCAGIVAALNNGIGVVGVAPGARLHAVKVLNETGFGYTSDVIRGLEWCVRNHMHVASLSLGGAGSVSLRQACDTAFAAGVLLVAAAGNSSGPVDFPAGYPSVLAVSATDSQDKLASFSNFGPEIALGAPGVDIYSTYKGGSYATMSGTSMACPHVAGTAALVWAAGAVSNVAVRDVLTGTAQDLGPAGRDPSFGYGLVDARKAAGIGAMAMHVSAIDMWATRISQGYLVHTKVVVVDDSLPTPHVVSGAMVFVATTRPNGKLTHKWAVTGADGGAVVSIWSNTGGTFFSTVTAVRDSLVYDPAANRETTESCSVP
jgi:subtilisin